ncbi:hypothetical protein SERLA73DRAFT_149374 [Serpula lacrymans var. lacrymans S7.3]|uniref:Uncharacterized protein n=1 Tax=Serpula lacrymans var. lacrymans (strain S7.3) TaxID=936435 RepID=F8PIA6_SERL3|nr:hypothetical protein SERLA73DRAFT_149374 [Serpula lacrymans var. lacrymans S7.3]
MTKLTTAIWQEGRQALNLRQEVGQQRLPMSSSKSYRIRIQSLNRNWLDLKVTTGELSKANKAQINAENARLDAEKSAEEARSRMLENKHRNSPVDEVPYTILKPRASELYTGKDRLRRAMGLTENKKKYLCIQARCYHPYLAHFQNDWATSELIKQYLSNWGKNESRKERKMVASTSPPDTNYLKYEGEQEQEQEQPQDGENTRNIDKNWD